MFPLFTPDTLNKERKVSLNCSGRFLANIKMGNFPPCPTKPIKDDGFTTAAGVDGDTLDFFSTSFTAGSECDLGKVRCRAGLGGATLSIGETVTTGNGGSATFRLAAITGCRGFFFVFLVCRTRFLGSPEAWCLSCASPPGFCPISLWTTYAEKYICKNAIVVANTEKTQKIRRLKPLFVDFLTVGTAKSVGLLATSLRADMPSSYDRAENCSSCLNSK